MDDIAYTDEAERKRLTEVEKVADITKDIDSAYAVFSPIYRRCETDMRMLDGVEGSQFDDSDARVRGSSRAKFSMPVLDKYVERFVGGYNSNPYGIAYSALKENNYQKAELLSGIVAGIENRSNAKDVNRVALRNAAGGGYGWVHVTTEYDNVEDDSLDVSIKLCQVHDYSSVLQDPKSTAIDGSDANFRTHIDYMSKRKAIAKYGEEVCGYASEGGIFESSLTQNMDEDTVPVITHYSKSYKSKTVYISDQGEVSEERIEGWRSKEKTSCTVICTKLVGNHIIYEQDLKIKSIPLVPVYGLPVFRNGRIEYIGVTHRAQDSQKLLNYSASLTAERLALSPKANYLVSERALGNNAELWKNSAKTNTPALIWRDLDPDTNQPIAPPIKQDTSVNLGDVITTQNQMIQGIGQVVGMSEAFLGGQSLVQETAEEVLTKSKASETILSTIYENLASSIEQVGRVVLELLNVNYDSVREVPYVENGKLTKREVDFEQEDFLPSEYEVAVSSGPLLATQRKENLRGLLAVGQLYPQYSVQVLPEIIKSIDIGDSNAELQQRFEIIANQALQGQDPAQMQAQQAQLQQQMQGLQQENQALKAQLMDAQQRLMQSSMSLTKEELKSQTDILKAQISAENKLDVERLKIQGEITTDDNEANNEADKLILENQIDINNSIREENARIQSFIQDMPQF